MDEKPLPLRFPTDDQISMMEGALAESLGCLNGPAAAAFAGKLELICRFTPLGVALVAAREWHGLGLRDAARRSGLRQREVRAIERTGAGDLVPWLVERYATFLGMGRYLDAWREANPKLAAEWGALRAPNLPEPGEPLPEPELTMEDLDAAALSPGPPPPDASREGDEQGFFAPAVKRGPRKPFAKRAAPALWQMKVALRHIEPPVWRRIIVPNTMTLARLHEVIQIAMGWFDDHLHVFILGDRRKGKRFGAPGPDDYTGMLDEVDYRLASIGLRTRGKLLYEYDFGDGWEHDIVLEKVLPFEEGALPRCIEGGRACPPEDCGGFPGYMRFCEVAQDRKHPEYQELILGWYGSPFDPEEFDAAAVNRELARAFKPRRRRVGSRRTPKRRWML